MDLFISIVIILSISLNIYLLYNVLMLQEDLKVKDKSEQISKARKSVMSDKCDELESKYLASKAINESLIRELELNREYITNLKLANYKAISSYYKRGNKK